MNPVPVLREVTNENLHAVSVLSDTLTASQKQCVAPNLVSVAQGMLAGAWLRAVYLGDEPIGFIMAELHGSELPAEDRPGAFLWRFMIAREHQKRGYGGAVLDQLVGLLQEHGYRTLYTSCAPNEPEGPLPFYLRYGFTDTGEQDDGGEEILRLELESGSRDRRPFIAAAPRIALITIWTDEMGPMRRFYCEVLGFVVKNDMGDYVEFEHTGTRFALCRRTVMHDHGTQFHEPATGQRFELAFPCDQPSEVDTAYEALVSNGAVPVAPPLDMPWKQRTALFADPDGNVHEIFADLG